MSPRKRSESAPTSPPAPPAGGEERRENRKARQILETARRLFLDQGYDAVSMDSIAREAGVSKATLYVHFENKEALFAVLIESECRAITDSIWPADIDPLDVEATLRRIAKNHAAVLLNRHALAMHHVIMAQVPRFPELGRIVWRSGPQKIHERLSGFLREATRRGQLDVPDPDLGAVQFLSLLRGDAMLRQDLSLGLQQSEIDWLIEGGIRLFMAGYARRRR